ncbi:MAG: hypothetical protein EOO88_39810, partial [Pedobacter sp.]
MFSGILVFAQNRTISGQVRNAQGDPVPFATVTEGTTNNSVASDASGNYSIQLKTAGTTTLTVSATNYTTQTARISGNTMNVSLASSTTELTAVVVTGLGRVRQKGSVGYAATSVGPKELTQATPVNIANGLTAKVSGLNITSVNSGVLGNVRITLRNIRSLTGNNQPMLILDGLPIALGYLSSINPNDIADITILKSAASTAIYGPDGVNGAIVVTTKRGSSARPVITVSHSTQLEEIAYLPDFQTRYGGGYNQDPNTGEGTFEAIEQQSWGDPFDGSIRQFGQTGPNGEKLIMPYSYNPNGRKNFFDKGVTNQSDISYSAQGFYLSAQNVSIKGTVPGDIRDRRSLTMRAEKELNKFRAVFNVRYTNTKFNVTTQPTTVYYGVTGSPGNYDLGAFKNWQNDYFSSPDGYYTTYLDNNGKTPAFFKDNNRQETKTDDIFGNVELNYKASQAVNFIFRVGGTVTNDRTRSTRGSYVRSAFARTLRDPMTIDITAALAESNSYSNRLTTEFLANYDKRFGQFGASATAGYSYRVIGGRGLQVSSNNLGFTNFISIVNRQDDVAPVATVSQQKLERFFGRVGFDWDQTVFLEGTLSRDRDSRFVPKGEFTNDNITS